MVVTVGSYRIFRGWVKSTVLFLAVSEPKFVKFWDDVLDPLLLPALFSRLSISCSPPEILALKVAIELQVGPCHCLLVKQVTSLVCFFG